MCNLALCNFSYELFALTHFHLKPSFDGNNIIVTKEGIVIVKT